MEQKGKREVVETREREREGDKEEGSLIDPFLCYIHKKE
jgi:hypothetical protein